MAYEAVKWRQTFDLASIEPAADVALAAPRAHYDLLAALHIVREMETSAGRAAVFEEVKRKNPLYRLVDALYAHAGAGFLQPLVLLAYMVKCIVSVGPFDGDDGDEAVAIANFGNEHHTIDRVAALVPDVHLQRLSVGREHALGRGQVAAALRMLGAAGRLWPLLRVLARTHSFMPSARIASALAFYMRFSWFLAERPALHAAIVASNYSPEAVGMAAAAHRNGKRVVYANHAPVPANAAVVPPVLADCAVFYGHAITQTYQRRSRCTAEVALIGLPSASRPMHWPDDVRTVGIFLTSGTRADALGDLIADIRSSLPAARILIRQHPVALLKTDLSAIAANNPNLEITFGNPLDDEIAACDLVVCGNSGVALNVLSGGRPVAYVATLDGIMFDCNGFVASGLVCPVDRWSDATYAQLKRFYVNPRWQSVMRNYDAAYGVDADALRQAAAKTIRRHLLPASVASDAPANVLMRA